MPLEPFDVCGYNIWTQVFSDLLIYTLKARSVVEVRFGINGSLTLTLTNEATVDAKPDFYDGARFESIHKQVREDLSPYIIPAGHRPAPVAPNFFIEAKAPNGGALVAKRQITYDLSLGARGMHQLRSYGADKPVFDNNAYTLGATYHAGTGTLQMYASHVTPTGPGGSPEYHTTRIDTWGLSGNPNTCRQGAVALRDGRDVTMEWRNQFISAANERSTHLNAETSTLESPGCNGVSDSTDAYPVEDLSNITEKSETSADEHAVDTPVKPIPSKKRPSKCWFNYGSRFVLSEATGAQLDVLESIVLVSKG